MKIVLVTIFIATWLTSTCLANEQEELEKECEAKDADACAVLGYSYHDGIGVHKSIGKAVEYEEKACELDNPVACAKLGIWYMNGDGTEQSDEKAQQFNRKACELGDNEACEKLPKSESPSTSMNQTEAPELPAVQPAK